MNNKIYPCIWCNNNAKEMVDFYKDIFPNVKTGEGNDVVVMISIEGQNIMLLNGGNMFQPSPAFSFMYMTTSASEVENIYNKLMEGGKALMPLDAYPFSSKYGWVEDKFGVSWQLYTGKAENIIQKIVPTLMFVGNNNGKAKEAVAFYTSVFPWSKTLGMLEYNEGEGDTQGNIKHGEFMIADYLIGIMDSSHDHKFGFTEGNSMVVNCKNQEEIDTYWNALTANGGHESRCGWLKDKYGLSWQIIPENIGQLVQSKNGGEALMKMKKIVITDLLAANKNT